MSEPGVPTTSQPSVHREREGEEKEAGRNYLTDHESEKQPLLDGSTKNTSVEVNLKGKGKGFLSVWKHRWKDVLVMHTLMLAYFFASAAYSIIGPFFPNEAAEKGSTPTITGVIVGSSPFCVVILSPVFGYFLPQLGLRFTALSGIFIVGGSFVLFGFLDGIPSGWLFIFFCLLLRMTEGTGTAMFMTASFSYIPRLFPDHIGMTMGLMEVMGGLGFAVGPPIGGVLYKFGGFGLPFFAVGGLLLAFVIPLFFQLSQSSCEKQALAPRIVLKLLSNFLLFLLVLANILSVCGLAFFTPTFQPFLTEEFGLSEEQVGLVFLAGPATYMLLALIVGKLTDKIGPRYLLVSGFLISGVGFFIIGPAHFIAPPALWITIVGYSIIGVGASLGIVPCYSDMLNTAKSMNVVEDSTALIGIISGIASSAFSLGDCIGSIIGGTLTQVLDLRTGAVVFGEVFCTEAFLLLGVSLIDMWVRKKYQ